MTQEIQPKGALVNLDKLPAQFPTHCHDTEFWESLGRVVATFGYLEEMLGKAIFAMTATKPYDPSEVDAVLEKLLPKWEKALTDSLNKLITAFEKAVIDHPDATAVREDFEDFITKLRTAECFRNVLCHGSWNKRPDENGASIPLFVNWDKQVFDLPIDCQFLDSLQRDVAILSCEVMNTVTHMGWQFPGTSGPGQAIISDILDVLTMCPQR